MKESEIENKEDEGKEIRFPFGYQRRSKEDIFKFIIIENRRSLRGFKRLLPMAFSFNFYLADNKKHNCSDPSSLFISLYMKLAIVKTCATEIFFIEK